MDNFNSLFLALLAVLLFTLGIAELVESRKSKALGQQQIGLMILLSGIFLIIYRLKA